MKIKFVNIATALVINFGIACLIEYITSSHGMRWWFIILWAVIITLAQVFFLKKKKPQDKKA
ncbi:hypothetical protein [Flavobacterium psychrotrophum]|uniref:hypothetical protein n=1 Tax=Flavobacterium psychrotrophum TaxID=2294119 RepID=UPI000E311BBF|nr:hypothetical protein [Flavobacterium psychrotrophum]